MFIGYDTISAFIMSVLIPKNFTLERFDLTDYCVFNYKGELYESGMLGNLYMRYKIGSWLKVRGSFSNYFHNYQIANFTNIELKECIDSLSFLLGINLFKSDVKKVDLRVDCIMDYPALVYLSSLGKAKGFKRLENLNQVIYKGKDEMSFYGKTEEQRSRGIETDMNIFRFENKINKNLFKDKGVKLTIEELTQQKYFDKFKEIALNNFNRVNFEKIYIPNNVEIIGVKSFIESYALEGFESNGGKDKAIEVIDNLREINAISRKTKKSLKDKVNSIYQNHSTSELTDFSFELQTKITNALSS